MIYGHKWVCLVIVYRHMQVQLFNDIVMSLVTNTSFKSSTCIMSPFLCVLSFHAKKISPYQLAPVSLVLSTQQNRNATIGHIQQGKHFMVEILHKHTYHCKNVKFRYTHKSYWCKIIYNLHNQVDASHKTAPT